MTSIQIIIHKKLNAIQCFCGFVSVNHKCKEKIQGKIIFRECNVMIAQNSVIKLEEMSIMKRGGQQIGMDIWFAEFAMKNFLVKSALTVFVKFAIYLLTNIVTVVLMNDFF